MNPLTKEELIGLHRRYQSNPALYLKEVLDIKKTWRLQDRLIESCPVAIKEHKPIYIASGHALGKDYICAGLGQWFLHNYIPSIVVLTGPTERQVKKIMWSDVLLHWRNKKIDLGGTPYTDPYLEIDKSDWFMLGFTTKESGASKETGGKFQGLHSRSICVIVSEAQAVEDSIFDQIDGITTSQNVLLIFIGNPTRAKGRFAKGLRDRVNNIVFNFSCLENPNYIERKEVIPGLASYEWVEDKRRKWGEDDPRWYGRVLGQLPKTSVSRVLSDGDIETMKRRFGGLSQFSMDAGVAVDPAGEGIDYNEFMSSRGGDIIDTFTKSSMTPTENAYKAVMMCKKINGNFIVVDCDGVGIGTWQELNKLDNAFLDGIQILKFHGSVRLPLELKQRDNYYNLRTEAAFTTQKRARAGFASIDPSHKELIEDLMEDEYIEKNGYIILEPKEDIRERLERSPGKGDTYKMLQWALEKKIRKIPFHKRKEDYLQQEEPALDWRAA